MKNISWKKALKNLFNKSDCLVVWLGVHGHTSKIAHILQILVTPRIFDLCLTSFLFLAQATELRRNDHLYLEEEYWMGLLASTTL